MPRGRQPHFVQAEHADWVFRWTPLGSPWFPKAFAVALSAAGFAFLLGSVRVAVRSSDPWTPRRASVIHVGNDPAGITLTRRAREGGPFPSRFDPGDWPGISSLEGAVFGTLRWKAPAYRPGLRELPAPEARIDPVPLSDRGTRVFPEPRSTPPDAGPRGMVNVVPVLDALAGVSRRDLPDPLPPFAGVNGELTAGTQLFLARLRPDGSMIDCVPLAGGDADNDDRLQRLGSWLRSLRFASDPAAAPVRWITVGVRFVNQTTGHGPQPE